jgi:DNA (cytosine-5)-methyltransferase 1
MPQPIPIIDLFAGPGGLGEGFSSLLTKMGRRKFKIRLSIEMDEHAHQTLELRAFFRQFSVSEIPQDYYDYLARKISRDELFRRYPQQAKHARQEAWRATLGWKKTQNGGKNVSSAVVKKRIRKALANRKNWVLIGGPPCQAYSLVGRSRVIGGEGLGKYETDHRHKLYKHYLRILADHRPPVFVMENVKGLLSAKVKEKQIFKRILSDLRSPTKALSKRGRVRQLQYDLYSLSADRPRSPKKLKPEDFVLRAEDYGIPQARHRLIIFGVRSDVQRQPGTLVKAKRVTVKQATGDLPVLRSGLSKKNDTPAEWQIALQKIAGRAWLRDHPLGEAITNAVRRLRANLARGGQFVPGATKSAFRQRWFFDARLGGVCNHETRGHIQNDLHRYLFAAVFAKVKGRSPLLENFPSQLLPNHKNVKSALKENKFNDRFRVQIKGRPSTTVVSHIAKDGHYYIHYDPSQCRSLTVREAARLQTFPDNYLFEGPRTEQYKQVGNAVPPLLARQIAEVVAELILPTWS